MTENSRETPLTELTLRKYERQDSSTDLYLLVRRACLSLGLLNPGDSRDLIVDVLYELVKAKHAASAMTIIDRIKIHRKERGVTPDKIEQGLAYVNVSRQLRGLKQLMIVEHIADKYRLMEGESLHTIFNERIVKYQLPMITERISEVLKAVDDAKEREKAEQ